MDITTLSSEIQKLSSEFETAYTQEGRYIPIKNSILREALTKQTDLKVLFEKFQARAAYFEKVAEGIKENCHSYAFGQYLQNNKKMYNGTDARKMADCDPDYIAAVKVFNSAYKLRKEIEAVTNAVSERHFTLKDITATINAGTADHIL